MFLACHSELFTAGILLISILLFMENHSITTAADKTSLTGMSWSMIGRIILKAAFLFAIINFLFAACRPIDTLGSLSLYNYLFPGRLRLPYGEVPAKDYNLTLNNIPAMLASHQWHHSQDNSFNVLLIGDSGTWGWFLDNEETLSGQLNNLGLNADDGRPVVVYNLGYPVMSLMKDLMLLDNALEFASPDLILWPVTMQSFAAQRQLDHPLLQENAATVRGLIEDYNLPLDPKDTRFVDRSFLQETLTGRRRDVADLLRLQAWGLPWAATKKDQDIPNDIPLRKTDLDADESWLDVEGQRPLTRDDLVFDILAAGIERAGNVPVIVINEPIFISDGQNSDIRYNSFYPRWAYDQFRELMAMESLQAGWRYIDLWKAIPPEEFTDTPVHLTPEGTRLLAGLISEELGWQP